MAILQQQRYSFISRSNRETQFQIRHIVQLYVCQPIDQIRLEHTYVDTKHYETYSTINALTLNPTPPLLTFSTKPTTINTFLPNFLNCSSLYTCSRESVATISTYPIYSFKFILIGTQFGNHWYTSSCSP